MSESNEKIYPSKIDWWVWVLVFVVPLIHLPLGIWVITRGQGLLGFGLIVWGLIILMIIMALSFPCRYIIKSERLTIRSGMVTDPIRISAIEEIELIESFTPAPALSVQRVHLKLADGTQRLISPKGREDFVAEIKAIKSRISTN